MNKLKKTRLTGISRYIFELPEALKEDYIRLQLRLTHRLTPYIQRVNDKTLEDIN